MQIQAKILELFSKKVNSIIKPSLNKERSAETKNINPEVLDKVIGEQLSNWNERLKRGIEKNKKPSLEFIKWVIIEYNLKSAEKINPASPNILNEIIKRLKDRGVLLDEEDINRQIIKETAINRSNL